MAKLFRNPMAQKRYLRFKSMKRAYVSLWILLILYGLSLFSELICNGVPLYVRFNGESFFPVGQFYSEDVFTGSGKHTRPDYKAIRQMPAFAGNSDNFMIFPPIPFGPLEDIDPADISVSENVKLVLKPVPRVGSVDIRKDFSISRTRFFDFFRGHNHKPTEEIQVDRYFSFPKDLKAAIAKRFANRSVEYQRFEVQTPSGPVKVVLPTYTPRPAPPDTIRMMFQEVVAGDRQAQTLQFNPSLEPVPPVPDIWQQISASDKAVLRSMLEKRLEAPVDDYQLSIDKRQYIASFKKETVQFPYPPVADHPMGIDSAGRDVLARILYGLRISLTFGLMLVGSTMMLGIFAGSVQGYYGGRLDITAQRLIEIWSAIPFLYVMILMGSIYGRSFMLLLICYGLFNWVGISYYVRAEFLNLRKRPFVEAAKCMGAPSYKIIFKHIMPNALVPVITFFPFSLVGAIGALAALDYLGFGLPPPTPSWGELLFQAQQYRWAWWLILYPSLALFIVMLLGVFVGEGIRNAYDPKQYTRLE
ncbi:MAG TPA: ABC transporter permease subunit [Desulfosalsimonadaceae bacterium]|nr:ABC transporter permease subunit [Desulfosalsimonadaceae bacterium]